MKFEIAHTTRYRYDAPLMGECFMQARLRPLSVPGEQKCLDYGLTTDPDVPVFSYDQPDQMGLVNHFIVRDDPHAALALHARSVVETLRLNPFDGLDLLTEDWPAAPETLRRGLAEWLAPSPLVPLPVSWSGPAPAPRVLAYAQALSEAIYSGFEYVPGSTDISTPLEEFIEGRRGVCQDYAHLMLAAARSRGIPARYVSGYVWGGEHGTGATHAWAELYLPGSGRWQGFDPTNNVLVAGHHIKIAVGRDYSDVPPTNGLLRAAPGAPLPLATALEVEVHVEQADEASP